jgi:hypothetical protein
VYVYLALQSHPTIYITYVLSWQLVSALELSHHQATNKNYKMEAEVKKIAELYLYTSSGPSWPVLG